MKMVKVIFLSAALLSVYACSGNDKNAIQESGTIEATEVVISSQVAGKIVKLVKDEGSKINLNDTLLLIDKEALLLQLEQADASREIAKAQYDLLVKGSRKEDIAQSEEGLKQAETNYSQAKLDKDRMENLFTAQAITKKQFDDAVSRLDITAAQLNSAKENFIKIRNIARPEEIVQAKAGFEKAAAAVGLIEKSIRDCTVLSPLNGFVVKKFIEEGETVSMMSSLVKVADLTNMDLTIYVSETDLGKVKLGQNVDVTVDSFKDKTFPGKVIFISPEAEFTPKNIQTKDERTKLVFEVKVRIHNPDFELKSGMPADAKIVL
jgi:HlyD family secretion protein